MNYTDIERREAYYGPNGKIVDSVSTSYVYDRTIKKSNAAERTGTTLRDSNSACADLVRDYNYKVTEITAADDSITDGVITSGETISPSFKLTTDDDDGWNNIDSVHREYKTGLNNSHVILIKYAIGSDVDPNDPALNSIIQGNVRYSASDLCGFYRSSGLLVSSAHCETSDQGTGLSLNGTQVYSLNTSTEGNYTPASFPAWTLGIGEKFCVAIAVTKYSSTSSDAFISASTCGTIAKKPTVHVTGGGVGTNGGIKTSVTTTTNDSGKKTRYGSWADLDLIAGKAIVNMTSGSGVSAKPTTTSFPCDLSKLTIANNECNGSATKLGYSSINLNVELAKKLQSKYGSGLLSFNGSGLINLDQNFFSNNNTNEALRAVNLGAVSGLSAPIYIHTDGDMLITSNIIMQDSPTSLAFAYPVILSAEGKISISEDVERLDAWLVAGTTIDTCTNSNGVSYNISDFTSDVCAKQLRINGPVIGNRVDFRRTYGADLSNPDPQYIESAGDEIDFNTIFYLYLAYEANNVMQPKTTYARSLAPRY